MDPDLVAFTDRLNAAFAQCGREEVEGMTGFPRRKCRVSSRIAAALLEDAEFGVWKLVNAEHVRTKEVGAHVWLERDGVLYDPTIHQFPGHTAPLLGWADHPMLGEPFNILFREPHEIHRHDGLTSLLHRVKELMVQSGATVAG